MGSGQDQGFLQGGNGFNDEQSDSNQSWLPPTDSYGQQQAYAFQPLGFNQQQTFHQHQQPINAPQYQNQISYGAYGNPQSNFYPAVPSYDSQIPHYSPQVSSYATSQYSTTTPTHTIAAQQYLANPEFYRSGDFLAEAQTISPQALQRVDLSGQQVQRSSDLGATQRQLEANQSLHHSSERSTRAGSQHANGFSSGSGLNQQNFVRGNVGGYSSLAGADGLVHIGGTAPYGVEQSRNVAVHVGTVNMRRRVRVTYPELLSTLDQFPARRLKKAPFVLVEDTPVEYELNVKAPISKSAKSKSSKANIPGSEDPNASPSSLTIPIKRSRGRPPKSTMSTVKSSRFDPGSILQRIGDIKPHSTTGPKSGDSPSSSEETGSSDEETTSGEESYDETGDEGDVEMVPQELSDVRDARRPTDEAAGAAWDATGIVFVSNHRLATKKEIGDAVTDYSKFFVQLRDDLKAATANLATAEAEKRLDDAKNLRAIRSVKRNVVYKAIRATIDHGHREIKAWFGKNERLVVALVSVLISCVKAKDYDSDLPSAIFELMSQFDHLTDDLLQRAKYEAAEKRFVASDKTKLEVKEHIKIIRSKTSESIQRTKILVQEGSQVEKKKVPAAQENPKARKQEETAKLGSTSSGVKRSLELDANSGKPNKKVASDATAVGSNQKVAAAKPRSTNLFASLKRPGLKSAAAAKVITTPTPDKKLEARSEPASTPQSSLAEILASIEKPREVEKASEAPPRPPETPEEKARRERKESRRHLRVRWKDGSALVEVKLFRHEQAEDEGRQDNMLRDAHDDRSEGMMLKQRVLESMVDDDDDVSGEIDYRPYPELLPVDFSEMSKESMEKNFATRGGHAMVTSQQQQTQDRREAMELMVVYTDPKDIPPSPKEPPQENYEKTQVERNFGQPTAAWLVQRLQEIYKYGYPSAMSIFIRRLEERRFGGNRGDRGANAQSLPINSTPDIASILNAMQGLSGQSQQQNLVNQLVPINNFTSANQHATNSQQLQSGAAASGNDNHKMDADAFINLERIVASLKGKPYPLTEPPEWMNARQKAEWWEGYNRDKALAGRKIAEEGAVQMQAPQAQKPHMQTQMQYPQVASFQNPQLPNQPAIPTSYDFSQLQSIYAGLNNGQNNTVPPHLQTIFAGLNSTQSNPNAPEQQQNWLGAWPSANSGNNVSQNYSSQIQQPRWDASWVTAAATENQRPSYETASHDNNKDRDRDGEHAGNDRHRSRDPSDYKRNTKPCKFWQEGKCAKGVNCTFRHDPRD